MELEYVNKIYIDDLIDNKQNRATEKKTLISSLHHVLYIIPKINKIFKQTKTI